MFAKLLILGTAGAALASPLAVFPRQDSGNGSSTTTSLTATGTDTSSAASSASSALSSAASAASTNSTAAPAPTGTPEGNGTSTSNSSSYAYECPTGYSLTYVLGVDTYPEVNVSTAYDALFNWNVALPPPIMLVNQTGSGPGEAERTWEIQNITVMEKLVNQTANESTGYLDETWVTLAPINVTSSLVIANATSDLTLFFNTTSNETSVQFYVNFCASSQQEGLTVYAELVSTYLTGLNALFLNATSSSGSGSNTTSSSSMMSSASSTSSSATGAIGSASSGASGAASTAMSGASGAGSTAISGASGAASTAISGASSVGSVAVSGASSVGSAGVSGASSVGSRIASAITARA